VQSVRSLPHRAQEAISALRELLLSRAEMRVLLLLPYGLTSREMGERLYCSHNSVKSHVGAIYRKLGAHSRGEAIAEAIRLGIIDVRVEER
jgi:LuxR family maltose regulon positive regulatory protein